MSLPRVSVIIPCYRQAHFLPTALESVFAQSYSEIEPIVVNDGSDDDTDEVARSYGDRIRYVSKRNGGLPSARNAGIQVATGKYLLFLDSDDALHPEAVERLVKAMDGSEGRLAVMGLRLFTESVAEESGREILPPTGTDLIWKLLENNSGPPNCYLSSKTAVEHVGLFDEVDERVWGCEDMDLWCRLLLSGAELVSLRFVGAYYRQHSASMSRNELRMTQSRTEVRRRSLRRLRRNPEIAARWGMSAPKIIEALRKGIREEAFDAGYLLRESGLYTEAAAWYLASLRDGGLNVRSLRGLAALMPHFLLRNGRRKLGWS